MGLTPDQFWKLTPAEFGELAAGFNWRQEHHREEMAWLISWMLVPHFGRKTPGIHAILGREDPAAAARPDGLTLSGDADILASLLGEPGESTAANDPQFQQLWAHALAQKDEGAAN